MNTNKTYELFKSLCLEYQETYSGLEVVEGNTKFEISIGINHDGSVLYTAFFEKGRLTSSTSEIKELLEEAIYCVGPNKFNLSKIEELEIELDLDDECLEVPYTRVRKESDENAKY